MKKLLFLIATLFTVGLQSQSLLLSNKAEISLITCGPGTELYAAFGHTAFRVKDQKLGLDRVYNYGTFDFNDPNFYGNFAIGNLRYFLSSYDFGRFLRSYHRENRWVKGQVLDLSKSDIQKIFDYLENNALPQNREYLYDYFFDNCSTKPYDVIEETIGLKLVKPTLFEDEVNTHRQLIQPYLKNLPWGDFGIDLGLGSKIDRKATPHEYLFLPENVMYYFDEVLIIDNGIEKPIVKRTEEILLEKPLEYTTTFFSPTVVFSIFALIVFVITVINIRSGKRTRSLDFFIFFITGIIGLFLVAVWFGTNHISSANNLNVLWAFLPNLFVAFVLLKKNLPKWISNYSFIAILFLIATILVWLFKVQVYSIAVLPLLILLAIRYLYLWRYSK